MHAGAELGEARAPLVVVGDDLAVEYDAPWRERRDRARDLGVRRGRGAAVPVAKGNGALVLVGDDAHAVELELVETLGVVETRAFEGAEHRREIGSRNVAD